jgi:hypothetical protein
MSLSKGRRAALACGLGVSLLALMVPPLAATASAASNGPRMLKSIPRHVLFDVGIRHTLTNAQIAKSATAGAKLATFSSSVIDPQNSTTYPYTMVGTNPEVKGTSSSTTVKTQVVPLKLVFAKGGTFDPSATDSCDSGASALTRTQRSPVLNTLSWKVGSTPVATGEYVDEFQRTNFWNYTKPTGTNPGFNIKLAPKTLPELTVTVPTADWFEGTTKCGNKLLGLVQEGWLQNYLQTKAIPSLASKGVNPTTLPIFLVHNVAAYTGNNPNTKGACCILGYHSAFSHSGTQTYVFSDYDNSGSFTGFADVAGLTHETDEWMDDPFGNNPTAPWGHIGQVLGCQSNLEVGDPLSGTIFPLTFNGFTYHLQELAFFSWFFRQSPSIGINGEYSNAGTFSTPAAACS